MEKEQVTKTLDYSCDLTLLVVWEDCVTWALESFKSDTYGCCCSVLIAAMSCTLHFVSLLWASLAVVNRCFCPQEWAAKQSTLKEEEIDITFSYWDGSGHRRTVRMKKGNWQPLMSVPIVKTSWLVVCWEITAVYCKNDVNNIKCVLKCRVSPFYTSCRT
jgi:hypothetical protein